MYSIDPAKIGDVQALQDDLLKLDEKTLAYVQGRVDQALEHPATTDKQPA